MKGIIFACVLSASVLQADTLYLRDGQSVRGTFISGTSQAIRFLPDGGRTQNYPIQGVDRLSFGDSDNSSTSSASGDRYRNDDRSRNNDDRLRNNDDRLRDNDGFRNSAARSRNANDEIPSGTQVSIRMIDSINSNQTDVGRKYRASLEQDLVVDGRVIAARGADATVEVVRVNQARAISGREEVALALTEINANGRRLNPVTENAEITSNSRGSENVKVIGGTTALGAIIGAIAGGGKGAAIGAASGAAVGAGAQAVRGQKLEVPSETQLLFTLSQPMRM
ncbi:MAG: hypothetical protein H7039_17645 [Bryobacteraceae bacterium]|nr:hypothetical protein [Bryobacteraceae bacterium]